MECKDCKTVQPLENFPKRKYATKDELKVSHERRCTRCKYQRSIAGKPKVRLEKDEADRAKIIAAKALWPTMTHRKFHKTVGLAMSTVKFYQWINSGEVAKLVAMQAAPEAKA